MADGYARASSRPGVVLAGSRPGYNEPRERLRRLPRTRPSSPSPARCRRHTFIAARSRRSTSRPCSAASPSGRRVPKAARLPEMSTRPSGEHRRPARTGGAEPAARSAREKMDDVPTRPPEPPAGPAGRRADGIRPSRRPAPRGRATGPLIIAGGGVKMGSAHGRHRAGGEGGRPRCPPGHGDAMPNDTCTSDRSARAAMTSRPGCARRRRDPRARHPARIQHDVLQRRESAAGVGSPRWTSRRPRSHVSSR